MNVLNTLRSDPALATMASVFVAFLLLQCLLAIVLWWRLERQSDEVKASTASGTVRAGRRNSWLVWANETFVKNGMPTGNWSRDTAMHEIDQLVAEDRWYLLLHKLGVSAPLLGVIATAAGFYFFRPPETVQRLGDMVSMITPLAVGVGCGAVLALLNQFLLWFVDCRIIVLKRACRHWFDKMVLANVTSSERAAAESNVVALAELGRSVQQTAETHAQSITAMQQVTTSLDRMIREFGASFGEFVKEVKGLPQNLPLLGEAVAGAAHAFGGSIPQLAQAVATFRETADTLQQSVATQMERSAARQLEASVDLSKGSASLRDVTSQLDAAMASLSQSLVLQQATIKSFDEAMEKSVLPSQNKIAKSAETVRTAVAGFGKQIETLNQGIAGISSKMDEGAIAFGLLGTAAQRFQTAVDVDFAPAAAQHRKISDSLVLNVEGNAAATSALTQTTAQMQYGVDAFRESAAQLRDSVLKSVLPSHTLLESAARNFEATAEAAHETIDRLNTAIPSASGSLESILRILNESLTEIKSTTTTLSRTVQDNVPESMSKLTSASATLTAAVSKFATAGQAVENSMEVLSGSVEQHTSGQKIVVTQLSSIQEVVEKLRSATASLAGTIASDAVPSQKSFVSAASSLDDTARQVAKFVAAAYGPAIQNLKQLEQVVVRLQTAIASLQPLFDAGQSATLLSKSLSRMESHAQAFSTFPDRLAEALAHSASNGHERESRKWWRFNK